jgi:hypothetical protein
MTPATPRLRTLILAATVATALPAAAQPPEGHGPRRLFISPSGEPYRTLDGMGAWLTQADTNQDGAVTLAEFRADAMRYFKVLDTNGDGVIDGQEVRAYEQNIVPEITHIGIDDGSGGGGKPQGGGGGGGGHGGGGGMGGGGMGGGGRGGGMGGGGGRGGGGMGGGGHGGGGQSDSSSTSASTQHMQPAGSEGASRFSLINQPEPILAADTNVDGRVTLDEWMKATNHRFEVLDKAKTGKLTHASLVAPNPKG